MNNSLSATNNSEPYSSLIRSYSAIYSENFTFCIPKTWLATLHCLTIKINTLLVQHPEFSIDVHDVKEKFGELRFYYSLEGPVKDYEAIEQTIEHFIDQANEVLGGQH